MSTKPVFIISIIAINIITALMLSSCAQNSSQEAAFPEEETAVVSSDKKASYEGSLKISHNKVYVSSPSVDVNVKRDNVPEVDFPAPEISVPSVNSVSPDFSVLLPEGITFEDLFENAEKNDTSITMDTDPVPDEIKDEIHIGEKKEKETPSANLIVTISRDSLSGMLPSKAQDSHNTPLTLYYRMSDYTYNGQALHGACTPMTMINCLNKFNNDGACTLNETLDLASRLNLWSAQDGMSAEGIFITTAALNELHSTANSAALSGPKDCDELGDIIDKGHTAGVCVDSSMLWKKEPDGYADHMIAILETDRDANGVLKGFHIIDNGMGKTWISADLYDECALGNKLGFCMIFGNPDNPPY